MLYNHQTISHCQYTFIHLKYCFAHQFNLLLMDNQNYGAFIVETFSIITNIKDLFIGWKGRMKVYSSYIHARKVNTKLHHPSLPAMDATKWQCNRTSIVWIYSWIYISKENSCLQWYVTVKMMKKRWTLMDNWGS